MAESPAKPTRILAIDYGMVRIGLALSDERKIIASPLKMMLAEKKMEKTVSKIVNELNEQQKQLHCLIEEIIVGLPLLMNGRQGLLADEVKEFINHLKKQIAIPITTWDERLSSVQAERSMRESSMTRKKRAKNVDTVSAVIILQSYLDFKGIQEL